MSELREKVRALVAPYAREYPGVPWWVVEADILALLPEEREPDPGITGRQEMIDAINARERLRPRYSGKESYSFWEFVHSIDGEAHTVAYDAACDLQEAEAKALKRIQAVLPTDTGAEE